MMVVAIGEKDIVNINSIDIKSKLIVPIHKTNLTKKDLTPLAHTTQT